MATSNQIDVTESPVSLIENTTTDKMLNVLIKTNGNIWVGGSAVTTTSGFKINAFETARVSLPPSDILYGYSLGLSRVYVLSTESL
ncbi:hypothetical protein [Virgibacillus sp. CBA3643]|uniref:hypothetical protein n=1 Tax=Virgibacillus sp. CBA3643 TaxID=2942278 RepID=UPI0035A2BB1B